MDDRQANEAAEARRTLRHLVEAGEAAPMQNGAGAPGNAGGEQDMAEYWGIRVGRILAALLTVSLFGWLLFFLMRG